MTIISTAVRRSKFYFLSRLKYFRNCKAKVGKSQTKTTEHQTLHGIGTCQPALVVICCASKAPSKDHPLLEFQGGDSVPQIVFQLSLEDTTLCKKGHETPTCQEGKWA